MERLTEQCKEGIWVKEGPVNNKTLFCCHDEGYYALKRLSDYEDTGLTPEDIVQIDKDFTAQAKELAELKELRIPKKPTLEGDGYDDEGFIAYDTWYCPNCNKDYEVEYDEYDYCPNCGQAIDWSENNNG